MPNRFGRRPHLDFDVVPKSVQGVISFCVRFVALDSGRMLVRARLILTAASRKIVTSLGDWKWPLYQAPRRIASGHLNFGARSNLHWRQQFVIYESVCKTAQGRRNSALLCALF